jgi:Protein of unknown function (DUF1573)
MRRTLIVLAALTAFSARPAVAQTFFESLFPERTKDLGTVAKGAKIRHTYRLVNTSNQDVHIVQYQTKCGCTEVKIGARDIPPGTQTTIEATIDTTRFENLKVSGLTVYFDRPQSGAVDLTLSCFIRGDITLNPGAVDFQTVARGGKPTSVLNLTYQGGSPNWAIQKVHTISPHVTATVQRLNQASGYAQYQLTVNLNPTAPSGHFKDEITLLTNDPNSPSIPISVSANIQAAVSVSPAILPLGRLKPGQTISREILVRSSQPFKISALQAQKPDLTAIETDPSSAAFHKVTVTLKAPEHPGPYNTTLDVVSDLKDEPPAKLTVFAQVTP